MIKTTLLSPPVAFAFFFILLAVGYHVIQKYSAKGLDHPEKHLPYSGGQNLPPVEVRLSYKEFFRLGLLFGIVHVSTLVLSLLPLQRQSLQLGMFYLIGISISAYVLVRTSSPRK